MLTCKQCPVSCAVFESRDKIVIVMEYASRGELYDYIQERRRLPETEARGIFRQITSAVHYCHKVCKHTYSKYTNTFREYPGRHVLNCMLRNSTVNKQIQYW